MSRIFNYFSSIKRELSKVSWSSKQELIGSTIVVFVFAIILAIFLYVLDQQLLGKFIGAWLYPTRDLGL